MSDRDTVIVLEIDDRFFCGIGKAGRIATAWSLAGATMYAPWRDDLLAAAEAALAAKGKRFRRLTVAAAGQPKTDPRYLDVPDLTATLAALPPPSGMGRR
jgi:hypothetical protein